MDGLDEKPLKIRAQSRIAPPSWPNGSVFGIGNDLAIHDLGRRRRDMGNNQATSRAAAQQVRITAVETNSEVDIDSMTDLQSLANDVSAFTQAADWWGDWVWKMGTVAAVATLLTVVCSRFQNLANKSLAGAEAKIARLKDEIALEKERAFNVAVEDRKKENLELQKKLDEARWAAESERRNRKMEDRMRLPRKLNTSRGDRYFQRLNHFRGTKFAVVTIAETEPRRTGKWIDSFLENCGWVRAEPMKSFDETDEFSFGDGIAIESGAGTLFGSPLRGAIEGLDDVLSDSKIHCHRGFRDPRRPTDLPDDVVRIVVGLNEDVNLQHERFAWESEERRLDWQRERWDQSGKNIDGWRERGEVPADQVRGMLSEDAWRSIASTPPLPVDGNVVVGRLLDSHPQFADAIGDAICAAGWPAVCLDCRGMSITGAAVFARKDAGEAAEAAGKKLRDTLNAAGIETTFAVEADTLDNAPVVVVIGKRKE